MRVRRHLQRQDFDRHASIQTGLPAAINSTHAAATKALLDGELREQSCNILDLWRFPFFAAGERAILQGAGK